jgi:hypothetical protein
VKLERLQDTTEKEREAYEMLAINLFSRHPPVDKPKKEFNCPKKECKARITEYDINCRECGSGGRFGIDRRELHCERALAFVEQLLLDDAQILKRQSPSVVNR